MASKTNRAVMEPEVEKNGSPSNDLSLKPLPHARKVPDVRRKKRASSSDRANIKETSTPGSARRPLASERHSA